MILNGKISRFEEWIWCNLSTIYIWANQSFPHDAAFFTKEFLTASLFVHLSNLVGICMVDVFVVFIVVSFCFILCVCGGGGASLWCPTRGYPSRLVHKGLYNRNKSQV